MKKIAIQGVKGAFHQEAAQYFFDEKIEIIECLSFDKLFETVETQKADQGIIAIENTIGGSILPNYKLLRNSNLRICGEIYLQINQNLLAVKGSNIKNITEVYSHPMAILQTQDYFKRFPNIKLINTYDTALSAKNIAQKNIKNIGAIAGKLAAKIYNLEIITPDIETVKQNQTRFIILKQKYEAYNRPEKINKASISFVLSHKKGSLSQILSILAFYDNNLTKIQSIPILGREWEYEFFVDLSFEKVEKYNQALNAIKPLLIELTILGEYSIGKKVNNF